MWKKRMWEEGEYDRLRVVRWDDRGDRQAEKRRRNGKRKEDWDERCSIGEVYWESEDLIEDSGSYSHDDTDDAA